MGSIHYNGKGVPKNLQLAIKWFSLGAEQGNAQAQRNLAAIYALGSGVTKDNIYAYMWSHLATINGSKSGKKIREIVKNRMSFIQLRRAKKLARECFNKNFKGCYADNI